jgi:hypothetical protein
VPGKSFKSRLKAAARSLALGDQIIGEMSVRQNPAMSKPDGFA